MDVLQTAVEAANKKNISTIVIASTTGKTAAKLLEVIKTERMKVFVVTHDEGKSLQERRFDEHIRMRLLANNITVYTHNPKALLLRKIIGKVLGKFGFSTWQRHLRKVRRKYGTGIKVCHIIVQMLREGRALTNGKVVAIAGTKSGADSAAIFIIRPENKYLVLEEVIKSQQ